MLLSLTYSLLTFLSIYLLIFFTARVLANNFYETIFRELITKFKLPVFLLFLNIALIIPLILHKKSKFLYSALTQFLEISIIFIFSWIIIKSMHQFRLYLAQKHRIDVEDNLKARKIHTQYRILERVIRILILFFAVAAALMTFKPIRSIGVSLFASAGVASIIIGFSAQKIIASIIAGIQLAIAQPIRVDDVVIVDGEWGSIEEINLTYVVVKVWDRRRLVVPTTYFIDNIFQNWTRKSSFILGTVFLYTDYSIPVDEVREELDNLLQDNKLWDKKVKVVQVTDTTEKVMELRILVSAKDSPTSWELRVFLRENLIKFIQQNYPEALPKSRVEIKK